MKKNKLTLLVFTFVLVLILFLNLDRIKFLSGFIGIYLSELSSDEVVEEDGESPVINPLETISKGLESEDEKNSSNSVEKGHDEQGPIDMVLANEDKDNSKTPNKTKEDISSSSKSSSQKNKSLIEISSIYNGKFENLQGSFSAEVNSLISQAAADYRKGDMSFSQIASKYISKGAGIEIACDKKVDIMLKELKEELIANNQDTSLVKDVESYYNSFKKTKKRELLNKAKKYR